jgi:poly-gamma-glutamate capsule biosynthesis protein CapA/YwtB (metallophosphatase superfamily)
VNDYEGIGGYEQYRDDLRLAYLATVEIPGGALRALRMPVLRSRRLRLERAGRADAEWLGQALDRAGRDLGSRIRVRPDGTLILKRARR